MPSAFIRLFLCACGVIAIAAGGLSPAASPTTANSKPGTLVVTTAEYGDLDAGKTLDVTQKVAAMVVDNSLSVTASNATLGNPGDGIKKRLKVGYTVDGLYRSKTVDEGETLDISLRLIIRKAVYGDLPSGPQADVTDDVADLVRKNTLTVEASNDRFGDTASGVVKKLRVDYTFDGVAHSKTVPENGTIRIAADGK